MANSCKGCYFEELCDGEEMCGDYYPVTAHGIEYMIYRYQHESMGDFYSQWNRYLSDWQDDE